MSDDKKNKGLDDSRPLLPAELKLAIREEIEKEFTRQLAVIKDWIQLGLKIVGVGLVVLTATFTVFGLTTWQDIKKNASAEVQRQAEALITKADSETSVKQNLDDLLNRATVATTLAELATHPLHRRELHPVDWQRISMWLRRETLPNEDFVSALQVLDSQSGERKQHDAHDFISDMLLAENQSKFSWLQRQPEKRSAILQAFHDKGIGNSATRIALSDETEDLRKAAIVYLREIKYTEAATSVLKVIQNTNAGVLHSEALVTVATLNPATPGFRQEVDKLMATVPVTDETDVAVRILLAMWSPRAPLDLSPPGSDDPSRFDVSVALIEFILSHNGIIRFMRAHDPVQEPRWNFSDISWTLKRGAYGTVIPMNTEEFRALRVYWFLLESYAEKQDFAKLKVLLPHLENPSWSCCNVELSFADPKTELTVSETVDGQMTQLILPASANTVEVLGADTKALMIQWRSSKSGDHWHSGITSDLKGKNLHFSLSTPEPTAAVRSLH